MSIKFVVVILFLVTLISSHVNGNTIPQSIKLALTGNQDQVRVTWFTVDPPVTASALYSTSVFDPNSPSTWDNVNAVEGGTGTYKTVGWSGHPNTALLSNLAPHTVYYYSCGDKSTDSWSPLYNFTTSSNGNVAKGDVVPFNSVVYGDMGIYGGNQQNIGNILQRIDNINLAFHVGDIAYADLTQGTKLGGNETVWLEFLNQVNPITSRIPYMTCPGNHDIFYDLAVYRSTFNMPAPHASASWYSFDYNGVHFVSFSTEHIYTPFSPQHLWLENNLKAYRSKNPTGWIIVYAHRPMYCSSVWKWCNKDTSREVLKYSIESLFQKYNVDLYIAGHAHCYERTLPVYKDTVRGDYSSPKATVHITIGTGGNQEGPDKGWIDPPVWSNGLRTRDTGFGLLSVVNSTHLHWEFIDGPSNNPTDDIWLQKGYFH
eukprot:gene878-1099_t